MILFLMIGKKERIIINKNIINMNRLQNYMFFENLEQISRDINKLMSLDREQIDSIITNGHDWVAEHITTAKDDIEEVTNFLLSNTKSISESKDMVIKCSGCGWSWKKSESEPHDLYNCHQCGKDNSPKMIGNKPYAEEIGENGIIRRTFSENVDESELEWHRDIEDRVVKVINENDWMIQFDNELPRKININEEIRIPKETFHRVIKGSTDLVVEIKGINEKDDRCTRIAKRKYDTWPSAYASGAVVKCRQGKIWKDIKEEDLNEEALATLEGVELHEKTDYSKEKDKGLHGWFERQGGEGKSSGWVDCNTCRKDSKTGRKKCKPCGRKEGEDRAKYPACRPTASACNTKGKGKKWGKKSKKNENLQENENNRIFVRKNYMKDIIISKLHETTQPAIKPDVKPTVVPEEKPVRERRIWQPKTKPKTKPKMEENVNVMMLNGREIDETSLEIEGVDRGDYPDFTDAFFSYALYVDGTELTNEELDQLTDEYSDLVNQMAHESLF